MWCCYTQRQCPKWQKPLVKYISVDPGKKFTLFCKKRMYEVVLLREISSTLETN